MADLNQDYEVLEGKPVPTENQPVGTWGDYAKSFGASLAGTGEDLAAWSQHAFEAGGSEAGANISSGFRKIFGSTKDQIEESINPETRKLAASAFTSPEFWEHPLLATTLKLTGMSGPMLAAALPGGLLADTVAATMMAAGTFGAVNGGTGLAEFYKQLDGMSDKELQAQSPLYKQIREENPDDEKKARAEFTRQAEGWGPAINTLIGAAAGAVGPIGMAARGLAGGTAVAGAAGRGAIGRTLMGGLEGGGVNALQAGVGDVTSQQAMINAHMQDQFDQARTANAALEGGALGGLMGGAVGLVAGGGPHGQPKAAEVVSPKAPPAGATAVTSDAASPQTHATGTLLTPAKPNEEAPVGNKQNAVGRNDEDYAKGGAGKPSRTPTEVAPAGVDPAIAQATGLMQGTPNETIAALTAGEKAQAPVTPGGNAAPVDDKGITVPEAPQSFVEQLKQIGTGGRKAIMLPEGSPQKLSLPEGFKQAKIGKDIYIYDPKLIKYKTLGRLARAGRQNEFLGLGPVSKTEAVARAAQGEPPVAVTERTPEGTEVKAAAGTTGTAPDQVASLEAQKTPGNVVGVETPQAVVGDRVKAMMPEAPPPAPGGEGPPRTGRVLQRLDQPEIKSTKLTGATKEGEATIAHAEALRAHEAETARLIAEGKTAKELPVEPQMPVAEKEGGKRYSDKERKALDERLKKATTITDAHQPNVERERNYPNDPKIVDQIIVRAQGMLIAAKQKGLKVQAQLKASAKGDAASDHPSIQILRAAKDMANRLEDNKSPKARAAAAGDFAETERLIRGGASKEVLDKRREEGDARFARRVSGEDVAAGTYQEEAPKAELAGETPDVVDRGAVSKDDVVTSTAKSAKMGVRGVSPDTVRREVTTKEGHVEEVEAAASAGGVRELTKEEKIKAANEALARANKKEAASKAAAEASGAGEPKVEVKKGAPERPPTMKPKKPEPKTAEEFLAEAEARDKAEPIRAELNRPEAKRYIAREMSAEELSHPDIHPHAREVNVLRRWVNSLSDADYNKLKEAEVYNFPRSLADTMEPGRLLEAWKRVLAGEQRAHIDPGDYSHVIDRTERELDKRELDKREPDVSKMTPREKAKYVSDKLAREKLAKEQSDADFLAQNEREAMLLEEGAYTPPSEAGAGTHLTTPEGERVTATRSERLSDVLRGFDFNKFGGVAGTLAKFFQSRLQNMADRSQTRVHFVTPEDMHKLFPQEKGIAAGFHSIDGKGISHLIIRNDLRDTGIEHGSLAHVVLHEAIHSITVREITNNPAAKATIRNLMRMTNEWMTHPDNAMAVELLTGKEGVRARYAFKDEKEFIAEAFSNPDFQRLLTQIPMRDKAMAEYLGMNLDRTTPSAWDTVRGVVRKAVEAFTGKMPEQFNSMLDTVMKLGEHIENLHERQFIQPRLNARGRGRPVTAHGLVEREAFHMGGGIDRNVKRMLEDALNKNPEDAPKLLRWRTFDNIAEIARRYFGEDNPVDKIHQAIERMRVTGQKLFEDRTGPIIQKLVTLRAGNPTQFGEFAKLLHDVTVADVHPDVAVTDAKNKHLGKDKVVGRAAWQKAQHPELARRYSELTPEFKDMYHEVVKHFTDTQNEMTLSTMKNVVAKLTGARDDALAERIHEGTATDADKAALGETLSIIEKASELSKIHGPYVPLMRRGDHVVKGTRKVATPQGAKRISENEFEFKDQKQATDYAKNSDLSANVKKVWVDKATGETTEIDPATNKERKILASDTDSVPVYRVEVQNQHMEYIEGRKAAERRKLELAQDPNMDMHEVVPRAYEPSGRAAVDLSASLRNLVKKLEHSEAYKQASPAQQAALRHAVEEAAAGAHGSTRISSRALPRRNVKGYSEDIVQNTVDYGASSSRYLARLQHGPSLEAGMEQMASQLKRDESKTGQYARTQISNEVRRRVDGSDSFDQGGKYNPIVKRLLSLSFIDKLGSPAYSVINAMQPGMVTMPYLIGRHGVGRSFREMARAYSDISALKMIRAGIKETGRRIVGKGSPEDFLTSITKNLNADERAMIDHHVGLGTIDPNAGMEVANIAKRYEGIGGSADKVLGYMEGVTREMPRTIEAINRAVTALAAYRLERGRGTSHEKAMQYSVDAVNSTQFNYSPTNTPPVFNHPLLKIALQFKKYGQGMYQLMGNQIGNAIRNENPGDRAQAVKTLITLAATHTAIAGALGLPTEPFKYLVMPLHGLGLIKTSWADVEDEIRKQAASVLGATGGEVLTRGIPRLFNVDLSRAGLDSITSFGEPKSQKEADVKSWLFDSVAGPVVSLGGDWIKGLGQIYNGDFEKAAENLIPLKAASDTLRAYRQATEGKKTASGKQSMGAYTPYETGLRVLGFGSGREANIGAERSYYFRKSAEQKEERGGLVNAWAQADNAGKTKAWAAIQKYNQSQPEEVKITAKELTNKAKRDAKQAESAKLGITPNKRDKRFLAEGSFFNTGVQ